LGISEAGCKQASDQSRNNLVHFFTTSFYERQIAFTNKRGGSESVDQGGPRPMAVYCFIPACADQTPAGSFGRGAGIDLSAGNHVKQSFRDQVGSEAVRRQIFAGQDW
jgi:hypothetical protein